MKKGLSKIFNWLMSKNDPKNSNNAPTFEVAADGFEERPYYEVVDNVMKVPGGFVLIYEEPTL